ncbi:cysteine--tRNA ligase [Candidatus Poribacteria bacterium]|nr:cysteine--tRNA ligase [Candidatus Poribacteria bacterium]
MALRLYNTLSRRIEDFVPLEPGKVRMYCCGPTVYDYIGIHNARTFVVFDAIRRYLEYRGFAVTFAQNVTDIDDKIIQRAQQNDADAIEWASRYAAAYAEDMLRLGVKPPSASPHATQTVEEIQQLIDRLLDAGAAYTTGSGVYFSVDEFPEYGKLSGRSPEDVRAGARVDVDEEKRDARDFALWKRGKIGEPWWESPWGKGRPGWHIECSAMVMKHLGESIDIHAGGADLMFPHHENEVAQSERATGKPFARYWMHGALVRIGGKRMGKSEGNFVRVRDALDRYPIEAIRLYLLSTHYRKPPDFTDTAIEEHIAPARRLNACLNALEKAADGAASSEDSHEFAAAVADARTRFVEVVDNDFNFVGGIGVLFEFVTTTNRFIAEHETLSASDRAALALGRDFLGEVFDMLGLRSRRTEDAGERLRALADAVLELRASARADKNWSLADALRDALLQHGVAINDARDGSGWALEEGASSAEAAVGIADVLVARRLDARHRKAWAEADALRDMLTSAGVRLSDTASGTTWEWAEPSTG